MTSTDSKQRSDNRYQVRALERGLAVLLAFDGIAPCMTATEIADKVRIPKPTLFRLLQVLVASGFLERSPAHDSYTLGARTLELGSVYLSSIHVPTLAQPILDRLAQESGETVMLGVLQLDYVLVLAFASGAQEISVQTTVGARYDPYSTALGKTLLAGLADDVRRRVVQRVPLMAHTERTIIDPLRLLADLRRIAATGIAFEDEERQRNICGIAAPVHDHTGAVPAALGVMVPKLRFDRTTVDTLSKGLATATAELSQRLGGGSFASQTIANARAAQADMPNGAGESSAARKRQEALYAAGR